MTAIQGQLALGVQDIYQPAQGYRFPSIALKEVPHLLCLREDRVQLVHHYLTDITLADQPHHFLESIPVHISTGESVVDEDDHLFFPFYRLVGVVAALLDHTMTVFVVGHVQVDSPVHLVFQFLKPALTFRPSRTLVPVQVKTVLNDTGWFPDSQGQVQHTAVLCLKSGVECGAKHCNGLRFQDTFVHDISPPKGRIYG